MYLESFRTFLANAALKGHVVHHVDVSSAFLNAPVDEDIYIQLPPHLRYDEEGNELVGKLNKALYGIHQANRAWNNHANSHFEADGWTRGSSDTSMYTKEIDGHVVAVLGHVDDYFFSAPAQVISQAKAPISCNFKHTDYGPVTSGVGLNILMDNEAGTIRVDQEAYIDSMLKKFGMENCKPVSTHLSLDHS